MPKLSTSARGKLHETAARRQARQYRRARIVRRFPCCRRGLVWWVIVVKAATEPECFIVKPDDVRHLARRGEKDDRVSY
jgi:hypothetical protein